MRVLRGAVGVLLPLGLLGCGQRGNRPQEEIAVPVRAVRVSLGTAQWTLSFTGDVKAEVEVKVFSKVPERIERWFVREGQVVRRGDALAKVVSQNLEQAVRQAEAALTAARAQHANLKAELERAERLYAEQALSRQQLESIRTQYEAMVAHVEQAEAAFRVAQSQLEDATVRSPIDGIVGARHLEAGDMASPGIPLATIVQIDRVKVEFQATERDLARLSVGQQALVRVRGSEGETFQGKVAMISPVLDPLTRMAKVEVLLPNPKHRLRPGMYAEVEVTTEVLRDVVVIPRGAVIERTSLEQQGATPRVVKQSFVFVVDEAKRARQRPIEVWHVTQNQAVVKSGLEVGDLLVVVGQRALRDGLLVQVTEEGPPA